VFQNEPSILLELQDLLRSTFIAPARCDFRSKPHITTDGDTYRSIPKLNPSSPNFYDTMLTYDVTEQWPWNVVTRNFIKKSKIKEKVNLSVCLVYWALRHEDFCRYSSTVFDLRTRWRWVASFTIWLIYPRGNSPRNQLDRRLGGPQSRCGRCGEETNLARAGTRTPAVWPVARCYTDWGIRAPKKLKIAASNSRWILCSHGNVYGGYCLLPWRWMQNVTPKIY
jgi:hypothetical protein